MCAYSCPSIRRYAILYQIQSPHCMKVACLTSRTYVGIEMSARRSMVKVRKKYSLPVHSIRIRAGGNIQDNS